MLDPRTLSEQRERVLTSCQRRGVAVDLDAAVLCQEQLAAAQTGLNESNRLRKEHQGAGKGKLSPEARETHVAEGRRLKEVVAEAEERVALARRALDERMADIPNLVHPDSPVGGEEDFRELRRVGEPANFDFEVRDHLALSDSLDLLDFEAGSAVTGQKFYFLKNEAVLLDLALQRFAMEVLIERGFIPHVTPDLARVVVFTACNSHDRPSKSTTGALRDIIRPAVRGGAR